MEVRNQIVSGINSNTKPNFKSTEKVVTPENKAELVQADSREVLASYNTANINLIKNLDVKPILPTIILPQAIDVLEGERIYTSDGKLYSIVKEDGNIKTTYLFSKEYDNMISSIVTKDMRTKNIVYEQRNEIENGIYKEIGITKNNPKTGKEEAFTLYQDGKPIWATKTVQDKKGKETRYCKDLIDGSLEISETQENKFGSKRSFIRISKDKKNIRYQEETETRNGNMRKSASFYNGALVSVEQSTEKGMPNLLSIEILNNENLVPAPFIDINAMAEEAINDEEGENTYYSNGVIETKTLKGDSPAKLYFNPDSKLEKFESKDGTIEIFDSSYKVTQNLENGAKKTTFRSEYIISVEYEEDGLKKEIVFDNKTKKPLSYHEIELVNGGEYVKSFMFDKQGQIKDAYSY